MLAVIVSLDTCSMDAMRMDAGKYSLPEHSSWI